MAWEAAYHRQRIASNVRDVRELAAAANPWACELIEAGCPEPKTTAFLRGDRAFPNWRPRSVG